MKKIFVLVILIISVTTFGFGQRVSEFSSINSEMIYFSEKEITLVFNQSANMNPEIKNLDQSLATGSKINFLIQGVTTPITAKAGDTPMNILRRGISKDYWIDCKQVQESLKENHESYVGVNSTQQGDNNFKSLGTIGICSIALIILIILSIMVYMYFNKKEYS